MIEAVLTWVAYNNPAWFFMIFPLGFSFIGVACWLGYCAEKKLEANPHRMDNDEYRSFNRKRFYK